MESHLPDTSAVNLMTENARTATFAFPSDVTVPESGFVFASGWQRRQRDSIVGEFTHVLLESGRFMYGSRPGHTPREIVDEIMDAGIEVALLWHGSDIRLPSEHARSEPDSPFGDRGAFDPAVTAVLERNARERRAAFAGSRCRVFVSTPGLLSVPGARWLPVTVDVSAWRGGRVPLQDERVVVAYAPSNSPMKGDASVDVQLRALESEGIIEYRRVENIPSTEMPALYRGADIVLDQFRLGDYGVAACEAMAAGRVVIGHVNDEVRARVREVTGRELPIVQSRYAEVGHVIRGILDDRAVAADAAMAGPAFAEEIHSGRFSAVQLADFLAASDTRTEGNDL